VRDSAGEKMSKSKGNVLDPIDLIDGIDLNGLVAKRTSGMMQPQKRAAIERMTRDAFPDGIPAFGTDAVRFTFAALASTGRDIRFDLSRVEGYRNFCNKLWNATRYVLMNTEGEDTGLGDEPVELTAADRWITSRLQRTERAAREHIGAYRFDLMAQALYEFTWDEYCDWYVELAKTVLTDTTAPAARQRGTRRTLVRVLEALLRLLHPLMPYITEELWQKVAPLAGVTGETISLAPYPEADPARIDADAEADLDWFQRVVLEVRRIRSEMALKPGQRIPLALADGGDADRRRVFELHGALAALARLESIDWVNDQTEVSGAVTALVGELKLLAQLGGLIDREAELQRLDKRTASLVAEMQRIDGKLANDNFVAKAPAEVVERERSKREEMQHSLTELRTQRERIAAL
jgi:valyl-tRNA synthetase